MTTRILLENSVGYTPEQVDESMTLGSLLAELERAIAEHGPDTMIVTREEGYGAQYGRISIWAVEDDEDDEQ